MVRALWALAALALALGGWYLLILEAGGRWPYLIIGVGAGIGCAVVGSLAHDALAGSREKL